MQALDGLLILAILTLGQYLSKTSKNLTGIEPDINVLGIQRQRHPVTIKRLPQKCHQIKTKLVDNLRALSKLQLQTGLVVGEVEVGGKLLETLVVDLESAQEGSP